MKVIDLLNKIAKGEEVPEKIKIGCSNLTLDEDKENYSYENSDEYYGDKLIHWFNLNKEVEIIEEEPRDIEVCGSLFTRSEYNRLAGIKEDKKIEKLDLALLGQCDNWIHKYNTEKKEFESLGEEINPYIIDTIRENTIAFQKKINEIIDYLEEKE